MNPNRTSSEPEVETAAVDYGDLTRRLDQEFGDHPLEHYVPGKTALRASVMRHLRCSAMYAEQIVDELEQCQLIDYDGAPQTLTRHPGRWRFHPPQQS